MGTADFKLDRICSYAVTVSVFDGAEREPRSSRTPIVEGAAQRQPAQPEQNTRKIARLDGPNFETGHNNVGWKLGERHGEAVKFLTRY